MSDLVGKAVQLAIKAHAGQKRRYSGEPYIIHPMRVADILINELGVSDEKSIALAFVHDIHEDSNIFETHPQIQFELDLGVVGAALILSKKCIIYQDDEGKFIEDRYWKAISGSKSWVKMVKLADRIDNLRDYERVIDQSFDGKLEGKSKEKRLKYMENTKKYVLPLAKDTNMTAYKLLKEIVERYIPEQ